MILPDVNVLLYAVNQAAPQHAQALKALKAAYAAGEVALAWPALLGFLRLSTCAGIFSQPLSVEQALSVTDSWMGHAAARIVHPGQEHASILARLLIGAGQGGPLVSDAHLAALAMEHKATLLSFDKDFARFAGLKLTHLKK
jgi:toxin-antitoxin system PIN domain toxin